MNKLKYDLFMREATHEEQQSVNDYVKSISINTGIKFFEDQDSPSYDSYYPNNESFKIIKQ